MTSIPENGKMPRPGDRGPVVERARFEVWQTSTGDGWSWTLTIPDGRDLRGSNYLSYDDAVAGVRQTIFAMQQAAERWLPSDAWNSPTSSIQR